MVRRWWIRAGVWLASYWQALRATVWATSASDPIVGAPVEDTSAFEFFNHILVKPEGGALKDNVTFGSRGSIGAIITLTARYLMIAAMIFFFFVVLVAGYRIVFQNDKKESLGKAQQNLRMGVIGLAIVALAYVIAKLLANALGMGGYYN